MHFDIRLWRMTRGYRLRIGAAMLLGICALALGIARYVLIGGAIARLLGGASLADVVPLLVALIGVMVGRAVLEDLRARVAHTTAARVQDGLRLALYDRIVDLGPAWLAQKRTGGLALSTIDGVEQLQTYFGQYLPQLAVAVFSPILLFAILSFWDVPVAAFIAVMAIVALLAPVLLKRAGEEATKKRGRSFKQFGEELLDLIQGLPTIKALGQGRAFGDRLAQKAHRLTESTLFVVQASLMSRAATDLAIATGAGGAVALGAWRVSHGSMSFEALVIVLMAGTEVFRPLRDMRSLLHRGLTGTAAAIEIKALLDTQVPHPVRESSDARPALEPTIRFDDVRLSYSADRGEALKGLSFSVGAGECLGVVGMSGAGKSSIVRLLLRLHDPTSGLIEIGGRDVTTMSSDHIRGHIAVVQQDAYLFHGTVQDNIRLAKPEATRAQVEQAARSAHAHEFIVALPDGYDTIIGERGLRLSGGQRQRIAIARAIVQDAPILVLDEATSSVDVDNERNIQAVLDGLSHGRTIITIAHRLSSVVGADRIVVVDDGRIVDSGTHGELLARPGIYRTLMAEQVAALRDAELLHAFDGGAGDPAAATERPEERETTARLDPTVGELTAQSYGAMKILAILFGFVRPWRRQLIFTVGSGVGRVYALIGVGIFSALAVAAIKADRSATVFLLFVAVLVPVAAFLQWNESWRSHDMAYRLLAWLRVDLYRALDRLGLPYLQRRRTGDLVSLGTQDVETVEFFFAHVVSPAVVALVVPTSVLAVLAFISWPIALVVLPFVVYAAVKPALARRKLDRLGDAARIGLGEMNAFMVDTVQGMVELLSCGAVTRRRERFLDRIAQYQIVRMKMHTDLSRQTAESELVSALAATTVLAVAALLCHHGALDRSLLPLITLMAGTMFVPVSELAQAARQLADSVASARRLLAVRCEPVRITDGPIDAEVGQGGTAVRFDRVTFGYREGYPPVLTDISLDVAAGARLAIIGASGAGKTTIANLMLRFWDPDSGNVVIGGHDLRTLTQESLYSLVSLVPQDTYLFNGTLAENVWLARPAASREEVLTAIERAALSEFVAALPDGLETPVGERGTQLSGGQRQRVAIARAFLKDPPVLILDEATSHLDTVSEAHVRRALDDLIKERTTIVIAHRLSTVRSADEIVVLDQGRVVERGSHVDLVAAGGVYGGLVGEATSVRPLSHKQLVGKGTLS